VGSIYRYFGDKRAMVLAMCSRLFEPAATAAESPGKDLAAAVAQYRDLARQHREAYQLMFWLAAQEGEGGAAMPAVVERVVDGWAAAVGDADRARQRWAMVHGLVTAGVGEGLAESPEPIAAPGPPPGTAPEEPPERPAALRDDVTLL